MVTNIRSFRAGQCVVHLIETPSGLILVDAGSPGNEKRVLREMAAMGRGDLRLIFITHAHFDHYGSAAELRRLSGAPIAIHQSDAPFMARGETPLGSVRGRGRIAQVFLPFAELLFRPEPTTANVIFSDGHHIDDFELDIHTVHLPGHTPGSSGLLVENKHAFVGDLLSTTGQPHAQRYYASDWSQIGDSLDHLKTLKPEWVYTGHGLVPLSGEDLLRLDPPTS